jgi:hypothetical protein
VSRGTNHFCAAAAGACALELLIGSGRRQWFVLGARDEIEADLISGLAAGGELG